MSIKGSWEVWELCEAIVLETLERVETQRKRGELEYGTEKGKDWEEFPLSEEGERGEENCFCGPVQCRKTSGEPFRAISNVDSVWKDAPEKPIRRPASSQSNRSSHSFLSPSEFNRPAFQAFLQEFLIWCSQTAYVSPAIRVRAEGLGQGLAAGQLVDVRSAIKLLRDLERVAAGFPAALAGLYEAAQTPMTPTSALLQAKSMLNHSLSSLSLQHLLSLRQVSHPSPEVEVTCLAFLLLLGVLDGTYVLTIHKNAWKAFQTYLRQPGKCLQAVKRTASAVETGEVGEDLVRKLEEKVGRIEEMALKGVAGGTACVVVRKYLKDVIKYHAVVWKNTLLSCSPQLQSACLSLDFFDSATCDPILSPALSFGDQSHLSIPAYSPHFPCFEDSIPLYEPVSSECEIVQERSEGGAATARFPPTVSSRPQEALPRSKSNSSRPASSQSHRADRPLSCELPNRKLRKSRAERTTFTCQKVKRQEKTKRLGETERCRNVALEKGDIGNREAGKLAKKPLGLTWVQLQVQRDKEKLERGMQKYAKGR